MSRLKGKKAVITGGTSGIGRSTVLHFVREGADVLFTGRDRKRAEDTINMAKEYGREVFFAEHDIVSDDSWADVYSQANDHLGSVDIAVNCAGIFTYNSITDTSEAEFRQLWSANVDGCFLGIKHAMTTMHEHGGSIVNVASLSGLIGHANVVSYCSSKAGAVMLTKVAAMEAGPNIRVNAVAPGQVWNELLERAHANDDIDAMKEFYRNDQPLKILGDSSDVANAVVYLASDEARRVTGAVLRIDAGRGSD